MHSDWQRRNFLPCARRHTVAVDLQALAIGQLLTSACVTTADVQMATFDVPCVAKECHRNISKHEVHNSKTDDSHSNDVPSHAHSISNVELVAYERAKDLPHCEVHVKEA